MMQDKRIIRIPLPVSVLRSMDELITAGVGGFGTRAEFVREAIESQVLELTYGEAVPEPPADPPGPPEAPRSERNPDADLPDFAATVLPPSPPSTPITPSIAQIVEGNLYGLHNRDYPSIWAAHRLGMACQDGPLPLKQFLDDVTAAAWDFGDLLVELEAAADSRLTPIFPTNRSKPQSAEEGFQAFAIGEITRSKGAVTATGPFFVWHLAQLSIVDDKLQIGTTDLTGQFLNSLAGISAQIPHEPNHAEAFLGHIKEHAAGDFWGFLTVARAARESASRSELLGIFSESPNDWTDAQIETNVAGFVSRCREWGLIEQKQIKRRYALTESGDRILDEWEAK